MRDRMLRRLTRLIVLCQTARVLPSVPEMAHFYGVCDRTIQRDLVALSEAGIAVPPLRTELEEVA